MEDDIIITDKKSKKSPNAGIPRMTVRFRSTIDKIETDAKFKKVWAKLRNLIDHPSPGIALASIKLYLEYTLGKPTTFIDAKIENTSPQQQAIFIKNVIEEKLGIIEKSDEQK